MAELLTRAALAARLPDTDNARHFLEKIREVAAPVPGIGPCLMWDAATTKGYGQFGDEHGRVVSAHEWLWELLNGPVPDGLELHHYCHELAVSWCAGGYSCPHRACVVHVRPTTHRDNMLRGSTFAARQVAQTRCNGKYSPRDPITGKVIGHDLTDPANVYRPPGRENERHCRACNRARVEECRRKARTLRERMARYGEQLVLLEP